MKESEKLITDLHPVPHQNVITSRGSSLARAYRVWLTFMNVFVNVTDRQTDSNDHITQGDHSPDNVKFPDGSRHSSTALGMLSVTHIMPVLVSVVGVGMQQYMIRNHILNI